MLFPESWLRAFVNPDLDTDALAHRLTMAGLEVEGTAPAAPPFSGVVVARIQEIAPHPNADKLRVCQVDDGSGAMLQIVCGAPNAAAGIKVPLARVGAELPGGMKIGKAKMRGVESSGMLCSARELGLSQDHAGLLELDEDAPVGASLRDVLDLDDTVFELKLTPNRADCLSILGVAREVSALTGASLSLPRFDPVPVTLQDRLPVEVQAPDLCGRFCGRVIRGVNARAQTPAWMKSRLERAGQRSVSALVDISNYVMLELGRPTHVFDLRRIQGGLTVRWARAGERLELLNGQIVDLTPDVGVIAAGEVVESMAGIMGGEATAVTLDTTDIYLEGAFWWAEAIMGRPRRYKVSSEASHRFERGVDFASIPEHLEFTTRLLIDICGGQAGPLDDQLVNTPPREPVRMRLDRCHRVLGVPVSRDEVAGIFTSLGLPFQIEDGDVFVVTPPSYRFDLFIEEDLIEEVARIYGFERIPDVPPRARAKMRVEPETLRGPHALRARMAAQDYQEVINFSFVEEAWERDYAGNADPIRLINPIASQLAVMRSSLIGGLVANVIHNANRKQSRVRVFELGRVFTRDASVADGDLAVAGVSQPQHLAAAAWGPAVDEQWGADTRPVDFFDVKRDLENLLGVLASRLRCIPAPHPALHPGRSARLEIDGRPIGWLGELHPRWAQQNDLPHAPVVFEIDADAVSAVPLPVPSEVSRQPVVIRDLAVWAPDGVSCQDLLDTLARKIQTNANLGIVRDIRLFDVWRDKSAQNPEKSMAFRFWLQDREATLDDATVEQCLSMLLEALVGAHGVRPRT
ncbi:phenylalanine--tRNA ligase subunit beta [Parapusillimonas granuli]|uniref:Phenylalanine--tRNA ligase beta subunit n=1 Tax=Parapusillimonas granuli TaxID=380911 RepID=A0A853GBC8_9BURK|nr:phenylalanine--tRNA ligase subunit beta [Parapusillimonas granuli]MBB5214338.1 phenylalanyl-tRNA synthetase beta chain [Parapusillimonas granuli]NYT51871.1 phenylalanine--tRNA ligase subunit beta [Parapusillimonas granuli]